MAETLSLQTEDIKQEVSLATFSDGATSPTTNEAPKPMQRKDSVALEDALEHLQQRDTARRDLIDSTLGDLEELCNDVEGTNVYSIRADMLKSWGIRMRNMLKALRDGGVRNIQDTRRGVGIAKGVGAAASMRKRGSMMNLNEPTTPKPTTRPPVEKEGSTALYSQGPVPQGSVSSIAQHTSACLFLLLESLCSSVSAEWGSCFVFVAKTEELVLVAAAGKKHHRPGSIRLSAQAGMEGHVLQSGIAVNVAHAYAEEEFSPDEDNQTQTRTKATLVFPLFSPTNNAAVLGIVKVGNKIGAPLFNADDECRVAECAQFMSQVMTRYPGDITNQNAFDPATFANHDLEKLQPIAHIPSTRPGTKVFRTAKLGHLRRQEVLRDATAFPKAVNVTNAMEHVAKMNDSWKSAVMLNIELEGEIRRLHEALRVSRREITRLQDVGQDLKRQIAEAPRRLSDRH